MIKSIFWKYKHKAVFPVVGTQYLDTYANDYAKLLKPGTPVELVPEPDNAYDKYAIMVVVDDIHIGYVPNKGYSCKECACPVDSFGYACKNCGSAYNIVQGGLAMRIILSNVLENYVAYVEEKVSGKRSLRIALVEAMPTPFGNLNKDSIIKGS